MSSNAPQTPPKTASNQPIRAAHEFGPYRLEVLTRRLVRDGQPVGLTPKAFDILLALIERRDRVVDKSELMRLVWPDSYVEEANLTQTIFVLRKTLGSDAAGLQYIETVPRRGYRFSAVVREALPPAASPVVAAERPSSARRWYWGAAGAVLVSIAVVSIGVWGVSGPPAGGDRLLTQPTRLVVLPFENVTGQAEDEWLAGAFSDALTSGLQAIEQLVLVSRDRVVELYRQQQLRDSAAIDGGALRRVAEALAVRHVVHGTYQRVGDEIRVVARLIDAETGTITAQETATAPYVRLLQLEDELAGRFAARLQGAPRAPASRVDTTSLEAYQAFIAARTAYAEGRFADAVVPLTRAATWDPQYAEAWALAGKVHARRAAISSITSGDVEALRAEALAAAHRAAALQPALYDAHIALALTFRELEQVERWREAAQKAIDLNPRIAEAYALLADSYFAANPWGCGRDRQPQLAEQHFRRAIDLDPRLAPAYANFSYHYSWLGREVDALGIADDGLAVLPGNPTVTRARALALIRLKRGEEADEVLRAMLAAGATMSAQDHLMFGMIALARGQVDQARREFDTALARLPTASFHMAVVRAYLDGGRLEDGVAQLERAIALDPACVQFTAASPAFAAYRNREPMRAWVTARPGG